MTVQTMINRIDALKATIEYLSRYVDDGQITVDSVNTYLDTRRYDDAECNHPVIYISIINGDVGPAGLADFWGVDDVADYTCNRKESAYDAGTYYVHRLTLTNDIVISTTLNTPLDEDEYRRVQTMRRVCDKCKELYCDDCPMYEWALKHYYNV